jgi:hypothetical protein
MTVSVQVFGRRHDEDIDALMRPATEKRQRHGIAVYLADPSMSAAGRCGHFN